MNCGVLFCDRRSHLQFLEAAFFCLLLHFLFIKVIDFVCAILNIAFQMFSLTVISNIHLNSFYKLMNVKWDYENWRQWSDKM